jgi:hypothetical protein
MDKQDVGATAFDLPNDQMPIKPFKAYYGSTKVPTPTNHKAMETNGSEVMRAVLEGK